MCMRETPAALIANNSNRSPKFPNVIKDANNKAKGRDIGIRVTAA